MAIYVYECPSGHVTERVQDMASEKPEWVVCEHHERPCPGCDDECCDDPGPPCALCAASRVFLAPAAIHYKGPGTYTTDYKLKYDRKRRPNAGDGLPLPAEAAITRAEGAEHDPDPRALASGFIQR